MKNIIKAFRLTVVMCVAWRGLRVCAVDILEEL